MTVPSLSQVFSSDFAIGAAVNARTIRSHRDLVVEHFVSVTPENEMKFERLQPAEGLYTFEEADRIVMFAKEYGLRVRGHTLVWHNQTPDWVFEQDGRPADRQVVLARMRAHIETVVGRYRSAVYCWDVVNEAVADEGTELLRRSKWLELVGPDYVEQAFRYAHEADPDALLFYNDYNECNPEKREKIVRLLRLLLDRGVPVHGVGMQGHWDLEHPTADEIRSAIERYASLGLRVQITELDVSVYGWRDRDRDSWPAMPDPALLERQAARYEEIFRLFHEYRDVIDGVTFWGVADDATWLDHFPVPGRKNWPLPFDEAHRPKPAFFAMLRAVGQV